MIALIALVAAIAIPNILTARKAGNEAAAIGGLKSIITSQSLFREGDKENDGTYDYGTLAELGTTKVIDQILASGTKQGYTFVTSASNTTWEFVFYATANPVQLRSTGDRCFATNHFGVIYYTNPTTTPPPPDPSTGAIPTTYSPVK